MKSYYYLLALLVLVGCNAPKEKKTEEVKNPFFTDLNVPVDYSVVTGDDISEYGNIVLEESKTKIEGIKSLENPTFDNVFKVLDQVFNDMSTASNNCFMLYWVSPDSLSRVRGLEANQMLSEYSSSLYADKALFDKMEAIKTSGEINNLGAIETRLVNNMIDDFKRSGVGLDDANKARFQELTKEITQLSADYSNNMNSSAETIVLDEEGAKGLPENMLNTYRREDGKYEIPVMNATNGPVMSNAAQETTRMEYYKKFTSRAADKNLEILDKLVNNRYELANIMGYKSYAEYYLSSKMAKNPETVWNFVNDLVDRAKDKAIADIAKVKALKAKDPLAASKELKPWDISYYNNQILKNEFKVDHEKIREYLPMDQCLEGVLALYQQLLGYEFKKIEDTKVWHPEVDEYEVYQDTKLVGRFYLDLYPRPNKESWFYGVGINEGKLTERGFEIPQSMLLGNFTRPTDELPSLLSFKELNTLFHEFGHIMDAMSYKGDYMGLSSAKSDFIESMSQIFENWTMDYATLSTFAKHYKTGEVLPKEMFENMQNAKNVSTGYHAISSLRRCIYDLNLYDKFNPEVALDTDELWRTIDKQLAVADLYVEGTHPQASWIHINTHPVYYYGYLWSEVYAQDMFTIFEENGLTDQATGIRFRDLILANGDQKDVMENVEEFLGRPSNNEAYIKSLGLQ